MVESDFAREYGLTPEQIAQLSTRRFLVLISGLPGESRFASAWRTTPRVVTDPEEIARLTGQ